MRQRVIINLVTTFDKPVVRKAENVFSSYGVLRLYAEISVHRSAFICKGKQFKKMALRPTGLETSVTLCFIFLRNNFLRL
jgi:hypothetical protein